jgi:hypothetical protein
VGAKTEKENIPKEEKSSKLKNFAKNIHPYIKIKEDFNDNLFLTHIDEVDDFVTKLYPGLEFKNETSKRKFDVFVNTGVEVLRYANHREHDVENPYGDISLKYGLGKFGLYTNVGAKKHQSTKGVLTEYANTKGFTYYWLYDYELSFKADLNRFDYELKYLHADYSYEDEEFYDNNRDINSVALISAYKAWPKTSILFEYDHGWHHYTKVHGSGWNYNRYWVGLRGNIFHKLTGLVKFGYEMTDAKTDKGKDKNTNTVSINLGYKASPRINYTLKINRTIRDSDALDTTDSTNISLGANYLPHFSKKLRFGANIDYREDEYDESDRKDKRYGLSLTSEYKLKKWLILAGSYKFSRKESDKETAEYKNNIVSLELTAKF